MPPYRQPTPSPPPPPVPQRTVSSAPASTMPPPPPSTAGSEGRAHQHYHGEGGASATGFEIPANFAPPPPPREVATGVANLGNTCYMNAALQALAHAPELCHALDAESHLRRCPVALRNERRRRKRGRERREAARAATAVGQPTEEEGDAADAASAADAKDGGSGGKSKKSHRRSNSGSSNGSNGSGKSSNTSKGKRKNKKYDGSANQDYDPEYEYCTLCEVERLMGRVHSRPEEVLDDPRDAATAAGGGNESQKQAADSSNDAPTASAPPPLTQEGPVVPEMFVSGFMSKVAPWFRRGVQEDSHEFLRLLIDAMQNSCKGARSGEEGYNAKTTPAAGGETRGDDDNEYPFRLFRGTVESNVKCSACKSTSCKIDPIEDIGLDILPIRTSVPTSGASGNPYASSSRGAGSMSASRSTSPTQNLPLADVQQALERFISSERLDGGYKCEKCGKPGKATKTSRLASIPPILTLHLKRFRYGTGGIGGGSKRGGGGINYSENGGSSRSSRSARVNLQPDFDNVGPSGSAKIEGHVKFDMILDMKPYLTPHLQKTVFPKALCRLFAVVCHTGKNSHSGHYVAYVHNVSKRNEWWKMDDAKVVRSSWTEVQNAEAYMLFYRVTSHPVAMQLKGIADEKEERARKVVEEIRRREAAAKAAEEAKKGEAISAAKAAAAALQELVEKSGTHDEVVPDAAPSSDAEEPTSSVEASPVSLGKRARPALASGEEWARAATALSPEYLPLLSRIQEFISDNVAFSPEFFGYITEEYNRMSSRLSIGRRVKNNKRIKTLLGRGPAGVFPPDDVRGGAADIHGGILDLFHQISIMYKQTNGTGNFLLPKVEGEMDAGGGEELVDEGKAATVPDDVALPAAPTPTSEAALTHELIIADNTESYDGAL